MYALIHQILNDPLAALLVVCNLILIESLLSVDNAAVLATMVIKLPRAERKRALRYGIIGAYFFRGICLVFAAWLVKIWWLKVLGGLYLIYLALSWWVRRRKKQEESEQVMAAENALYKYTLGIFGSFWATVISVELMDLAFSMDNIFAAVALSNNILVILCGVFIGILAMRYVAGGFVKLMERYAYLEGSAYLVIALLGIKLGLSLYEHFYPASAFSELLENKKTDWILSGITISIFLLPLITSFLFNFPARNKAEK